MFEERNDFYFIQWAKSPKKSAFFVNSALKIQCHVVKFFGDFAHWVSLSNLMYINKYLFV